jgi:hypothetical protein
MRVHSLLAAVALTSIAFAGGNQAPFCTDGGTISVPCAGATTTVTLTSDAYDPDGDPLSYQWLSCPGSFLTDPTSPVTDLVLDTSGTCDVNCGVRLRLTDPFGAQYVCRLYVQVYRGTEGCTPGYWKNHAEAWHNSGFTPTDDFDTVFGVNAFDPNRNLMQALNSGGGGLNKLARHGTAALLNAGDVDVAFALALGEVIDLVHDAIVSGQYEPLATQLDLLNNGGCPQNANHH